MCCLTFACGVLTPSWMSWWEDAHRRCWDLLGEGVPWERSHYRWVPSWRLNAIWMSSWRNQRCDGSCLDLLLFPSLVFSWRNWAASKLCWLAVFPVGHACIVGASATFFMRVIAFHACDCILNVCNRHVSLTFWVCWPVYLVAVSWIRSTLVVMFVICMLRQQKCVQNHGSMYVRNIVSSWVGQSLETVRTW